MDKCREEFEQYIRDQSAFTADFQIGCNGQYKSDLMHFMFVTWQHQQAKVEELQLKISEDSRILHNVIDLESKKNGELQKRVDALELKLREIAGIARRARHGEYYTESGRNAGLNIAAEIEQALKGDQYDEHRKKAEEAISKGASLTNHRIEL
ncbi:MULTISPECIES: hypothetical protein [Gammaproteobacteria]|uniref:hypothetical protein n=1 Tax=Gammaproteobacteria TaxID=1236 RepID=UPI0009A30FC1|nr:MULTISPECIES: hypothetical protein [Gammaproteobacteria]MDQ8869067.1 hypothetical protein [Acinetobacter baumannii]MDQ9838190.1 hypothetical protein [Acinetobacter baumannii]MED6004932.1 hypothetical protein [Klebsiella pneumoniae]MED6058254.1 hypothetical protein [Klebsiella pneumoniae]